jgi:pyruvate dehydrogenase E1 component beta subunit
VVNQIAKWHFMYGGQLRAPIVIRMVIGRGWGQGPQHSQSLQAWFAHIPGLKVIMPVTPYDAKGMLISAVRDDSPVLIFEHRWLYGVEGHVPEGLYDVPLDRARLALPGRHITLAATSFMVLESLRAASLLAPLGIEAEVLDLRAIAPMDNDAIIQSVQRTGAIIAIDTGTAAFGTAAEILAVAVEGAHGALKYAPRRIGLPNVPSPASPTLADAFFPRAWQIARTACEVLGVDVSRLPPEAPPPQGFYDVPDSSFKGPY